jgi:hypothetical protein
MATESETITAASGPGVQGTNDGVSPVRGDHPPAAESNLRGVGGLPRVQSSHPDRKPQEIPAKSPAVGKRTVKEKPEKGRPLELKTLNLEEKIGVLNALKKIRKKAPRVSDPEISALLAGLYRAWVDETILSIISPTSSAVQGFTEAEANALKVLAQTILQRQANPAIPSPQIQIPNPSAAPMVPRKGLSPGVDVSGLRDAQARFLDELSRMDRQEDPDAKWRR